MRAFVAISVLDDNSDLVEAINRVIQSHVYTEIYVYDLTRKGLGSEMRRFIKSYNKFRVFSIRVKLAAKTESRDERTNMGIAESLLLFNKMKSKGFESYVHINQGMIFSDGDLKSMTENSKIYHGISPVIESCNGIEVLKAMFTRFDFEIMDLEGGSLHFITGKIEDSFALNPKCFALSTICAHSLRIFTYSKDTPAVYLNSYIYKYSGKNPKVDTSVMVHEHLY